jgi:ADP-heptose:LPS heptosyltransferase
MTKSWQHCKNILIIRADNMGDLIMSSPAIRALKETFRASTTVLTSSMAAGIVPCLVGIDEVLVFDLPWVKTSETADSAAVAALIDLLKQRKFDAVVIFTVFSQNPLPAAMIAYMADIPLRLAYCRENPYGLLTDWIPDEEPYTFIQHQVRRDLALVNSIGAATSDVRLSLTIPDAVVKSVHFHLKDLGIDLGKPWIICHAGVSEKKRQYPNLLWIEVATKLKERGFQVLFTGSGSEKEICETLALQTGVGAYSVAGLFSLQQFVALVQEAPLLLSVNTGPVHIAAAVHTPVVVLYAQTNPQHMPWMVPNKVLEFEVPEADRSKNEVIRHLYQGIYSNAIPMPGPDQVVEAVMQLLEESGSPGLHS